MMTVSPGIAANSAPVMLKHYRLGERLGQGGSGDVMAAWDTVLQRHVAIKRLRGMAGSRSEVASLLAEARAGASLDHPAFVKVHAIEEDSEGHAIIMERIHGVTLRALIQEGPPPLAKTLDLLTQAAHAMQAAHARTLVHGDLKPSNMMVDASGVLRILDLGLAFHDDAQATCTVMQPEQQGTIAYMAPECLRGTPPGRRSDIYALGVVLYEMVTGHLPFPALSGLALAAAQMQSDSALWSFPEETPRNVVNLVMAMTAHRPDLRLPSMDHVVAQLATCHNVPLAGRRVRNRWRRMRSALRGRWLAATVAMMLVAGVAAVIVARPWQQVVTYSRAASIGQALDALELFDQPEQLDTAAAGFTALVARDPNHAAAVAGLSLVDSFRYAADTQDETWLRRADASAQQALRLEPTLALAHAARAWVLANRGQRAEAVSACEHALKLEPGNFFAEVGKATFLTQMERFDEAAAAAQAALSRHPQRVFSDTLGTVHYMQGNYAAAEQDFRRSIALQADSSNSYANLNAALLRLGRADEALRVVQRGLLVRPNAWLYTNLGNALYQRGEYVAAADAFARAVNRPAGNPNNYLGWANLADTLRWLPGQAAATQSAYGRARALLAVQLARAPHDSTLLSRMGVYAARSQDAGIALRHMALALAAAPANPDVHYRAALICELLHRRDQALDELAMARQAGYPAAAIEADPDFVALRRDARYQSPTPSGSP